jgi:hypothetical protein
MPDAGRRVEPLLDKVDDAIREKQTQRDAGMGRKKTLHNVSQMKPAEGGRRGDAQHAARHDPLGGFSLLTVLREMSQQATATLAVRFG